MGSLIYFCADGSTDDSQDGSACDNGGGIVGSGPLNPTSLGITPPASPSTSSIFGGIGSLFGGIATDIATDFRAISLRPASTIQNIPGVGTLVNGQLIPVSGLGSLTSGNNFILLILAALAAFFFLRKK